MECTGVLKLSLHSLLTSTLPLIELEWLLWQSISFA